MFEGKSTLIWTVICSILGVTFGYFFNAEGLKIITKIWLVIGGFTGLVIYESSDIPPGPVLGWLTFGVFLGITVALLHYESWLSPLLK